MTTGFAATAFYLGAIISTRQTGANKGETMKRLIDWFGRPFQRWELIAMFAVFAYLMARHI